MILYRYIKEFLNIFSKEEPYWEYKNACVLLGAEAMYTIEQEPFFFQVMKQYIDHLLTENGTIVGYNQEDYNLDHVLAGRILFSLYEKDRASKYKIALETLMNQIRQQPRTICGNFWHKKIYPNQVWLDGLYMSLPFYAQYEKNYGDGGGFNDILTQIFNVHTYLYNTEKKLYYHGWDESHSIFWSNPKTGCSPNFWLRAMGWYLMALIDVYELLPVNHPNRKKLANIWKEALDGLLSYQDAKTGLFYQLIDLSQETDNYLESSGSLMAAYSILKGIHLKLLDAKLYLFSAEKILASIESNLLHNGWHLSLKNCCKGAGLGPVTNPSRDGSVKYYLSEPVVSDERKAVGVLMMAYAQWLLLKREQEIPSKTWPEITIWQKY